MVAEVTAIRTAVDRSRLAEEIVGEFKRRTPTSAAAFAEAKRVMPGGDTRTVAFHAPYPLTVERGQGCRFVDVDGNEYIDVLNNYTSLIHGHAHPAITAAVIDQLPKGTNYATGIEAQTKLARISGGPSRLRRSRSIHEFRYRSNDERGAGGTSVHGPRSDRQDGRRLSRLVRRFRGECSP